MTQHRSVPVSPLHAGTQLVGLEQLWGAPEISPVLPGSVGSLVLPIPGAVVDVHSCGSSC